MVNVRDYGAVGDGVSDDTGPIRAAVNAVQRGGTVYVPSGWYRLTDEVKLAPGVTILGDHAGDPFNGDPPSRGTVPSYLFQMEDRKAVFVIPGGATNVAIRHVSLAPSRVPSRAGSTTGKVGIRIAGTWPRLVFNLAFEGITFYDLEFGISCVDEQAGDVSRDHPFDWSVSGVDIRNCRFLFPTVGVYVDTNNADMWKLDGCGFNVPAGGDGVYLQRAGLMYMVNCAGGGNEISNNRLIRIAAHRVGGADNLVLDGCQAETLANFIRLEPGGGNTTRFVLSCRHCVAEMGAEIHLADTCHFVSIANRWSVPVVAASDQVRISSLFDRFDGDGRLRFTAGDARTCITNLVTGPDTSATLADTTVLGGMVTQYGMAPPTTGAWRVGDRVVNKAPRAGRPKAWVCTVAGTPGTWLSEGAL